MDYDGKVVAQCEASGKISLGKLPVGYYEIPGPEGKRSIGIGVLAPLAAPTPLTSPIGTDASVPWSLGNKLPEVGNLCALAGRSPTPSGRDLLEPHNANGWLGREQGTLGRQGTHILRTVSRRLLTGLTKHSRPR
jgi:hypothetical protein